MRQPTLLLAALSLAACAKTTAPVAAAEAPAAAPADPLAGVLLEPLPLWTNKYAATAEEFGDFFRLTDLMASHHLDRLQAIEVQNHVRDQLRATPGADRQAVFDEALRRARAYEHESGLSLPDLDAADFIVVFDLDDTLLDQYYPAELGEACNDLALPTDDGGTRYVKLTPGWDEAFATIRELGGAVVLFSANVDDVIWEDVRAWTWEDQPVAQHPDIAGIMTNSYLMLQSKHEGRGQANPRKGSPVTEPSKDLRIVDPTLDKAIIVDDNPRRIFQHANTRAFRKFHAEDFCNPEADPAFRRALKAALPTVTDEIRETVAWRQAHPKVSFADAYRPYTMLGQVAVQALMDGNGWERNRAIAYVRNHPDAVDGRF